MRSVQFVSPTEGAFLGAIAAAVAAGARRLHVPVANPLALSVARQAAARFPDVAIAVGGADDEAEPAPVAVVCETDGERMTAALMGYVDRAEVTVIAAITDHYWNRRPLFLISIPKSGTHLLSELAYAFGYASGGDCHPSAMPGHWHFLEFTNTHTAATDFFVDTVRRAPHGNRAHPFAYHPSLFIYRNPLDIVASEANYYHEDGSTSFAGYLSSLSYEQRLLRLIDDRWLLGSIRDRVAKFAAWLEFSTVLPVSYEELVGAQGGGSDAAQRDLVWSLMLRLHVPGRPADIAARVFNPEAATFRAGRIGSHERHFTPAAWEKFRALPQDFMQVFGYGERPAAAPWLPSRRDEFRRRLPHYSRADAGKTAFVVRSNFLGKKIVQYRDRFWAIPTGGDITDDRIEAAKREGLYAEDLDTIEFLVQTKTLLAFLKDTANKAARLAAPQVPPVLQELLDAERTRTKAEC
ncbi:MAG: DUF4604 domain-containing protein [Alphaproteobacteria bacterium]|nr:DUF4604 domain-containing protein [Alphaproteobacteria bacterium]